MPNGEQGRGILLQRIERSSNGQAFNSQDFQEGLNLNTAEELTADYTDTTDRGSYDIFAALCDSPCG